MLSRALALVGALAAIASCSCGENVDVTSGGQGGKAAVSSGKGGQGASASASSSTGMTPFPCADWPGWETWDDFGIACSFCVPLSKDALPDPILWEPCDSLAGMPSGCRTMKITWPFATRPLAVVFSADVVSPEKVLLRFTRVSLVEPRPYLMQVVAEADGPVLSGFLNTEIKSQTSGCVVFDTHRKSLRHGKTLFEIEGDNPNQHIGDHIPGAIVGGNVGVLHPGVLGAWQDYESPGFATTDLYWGTYDSFKIQLAPWGGTLETIFTSSQADGLQQVRLNPWHDIILWRSSNLVYAGAMAWTPPKGPYPFITFPGDVSRGIHSLGTDGIDMVWLYGEGKGPGEDPYPVCSVMTSPFTKDPALLKPKRLRSFPGTCHEVDEWEVGCGYAAHHDGKGATMVVRLSDGVSWLIKAPKQGPDFFSFQEAVAITCQEVFVRTNIGSIANIGRVKLDALGPGSAPD